MLPVAAQGEHQRLPKVRNSVHRIGHHFVPTISCTYCFPYQSIQHLTMVSHGAIEPCLSAANWTNEVPRFLLNIKGRPGASKCACKRLGGTILFLTAAARFVLCSSRHAHKPEWDAQSKNHNQAKDSQSDSGPFVYSSQLLPDAIEHGQHLNNFGR